MLRAVPGGIGRPLLVKPLLVAFSLPLLATVMFRVPALPSRRSPTTCELLPTVSVLAPLSKLMLPVIEELIVPVLPEVVMVSSDAPR